MHSSPRKRTPTGKSSPDASRARARRRAPAGAGGSRACRRTRRGAGSARERNDDSVYACAMCSSTPSKPHSRARSAACAVRVDDGVDVVGREHVDRLPPARARDLEEVDDLRDDLAPAPRRGSACARSVRPGLNSSALMRSSGPLLDWCTAIASMTTMPAPPLREAHVARADVVVDDAVLARQARDHRGQDDAVGQRHRADGRAG